MAQIKNNTTCPKCGKNLPAGMKFCGECGTSLAMNVGGIASPRQTLEEISAPPAPHLIPGVSRTVSSNTSSVPQGVNKATLREWLIKFGIPHERIYELPQEKIQEAPEEDRVALSNFLIVPYKMVFNSAQGELPLEFELKIMIQKKWLNCKLMIMRNEEIPPNLRTKLNEKLLNANFDLNEVTFSLSPEGDVFVEADMPVDTDYTNFESEYGSIEYGVIHFLEEILPNLANVHAKGTYRHELYT